MEQFQKAIRKVRQVQRMRKQRGYAFSQGDEGAGTRLINAYDTTQARGEFGERRTAAPGTNSNSQYLQPGYSGHPGSQGGYGGHSGQGGYAQ
jgi:phospholipid-transporting ATPase